jgi:hypothetical protein
MNASHRSTAGGGRSWRLLQLPFAVVILAMLGAAVLVPRLIQTPQKVSPSGVPAAILSPAESPQPSLATHLPGESSSACVTSNSIPDRVSVSVRDEIAHSDGLVVGSITNVGQAEIGDVPNGQTPTGWNVFTPVTISVSRVLAPSASSPAKTAVGRSIVVRLFGGTVGCSVYRVAGFPIPRVGNSIALFLNKGRLPQFASARSTADFWA